jgi:asparagine synthase (glutamine-hydrolysing)
VLLCGIFLNKQTQQATNTRLTEKVMCSIFGVFDIKTDAVELRKKALELSRLMRHRGPDWSGIYASDNAISLTNVCQLLTLTRGRNLSTTNKKPTYWR